MTSPRQSSPWMVVAGTLLVLVGLGSWALYVETSANEPHAYARSGKPPQYVEVQAGKAYRIAIRGGVAAEAAAGISTSDLSCTAARPGQSPGALNLSDESADTKATNDIASFISDVTGKVHIQCAGLGPVFVDNAEDAAYDWASFWLVVASISLVIGTALVLSALRTSGSRRSDDDIPADSVATDVERVDPAAEELL